ncbi:IS5 family transposase [Tunturiibacter lichenicola]|uniref:IS5 family transposase n=1 Tax=Tunturiibacter lichenicola TaxID=2051959 RepID=UPI003D9AD0FC
MRGDERLQGGMFSYVTLEQRVPEDHPLREIRRLTDVILRSLSAAFDEMYSASGRPSIAPEYVLRALLLQAFYSVRSERQLVEQLDYNLLFRWFVGLGMDDAVWNHAVFSKNCERLLTSEVAQQFFAEVNKQAKHFMSDEHFTVDGTLIQAWASQKSFRRKDGSEGDSTNFHGQQRKNETHESTTDPDARLYKKSYGKESHLAYLGHALVENRNGLIAAAMVTQADGYAEREAALLLLEEKQRGSSKRITVGADKAYDTKDFLHAARELNVTAHVSKNEKGRRSNLDRRTTRHPGYAISLSRRWLVEKSFGWLKHIGPLRQVKLRGLHKVDWIFVFSCAAHNLVRLPRLIAHQAGQGPQQQCA